MTGSKGKPAEDYATGPTPAARHLAYLSRMDAAIQLSEITERYDSGARPALGGVGLSAAHAEAAAVAWPSGSGKRLSAGLQRQASGAVTVDGQRTATLSQDAAAERPARGELSRLKRETGGTP